MIPALGTGEAIVTVMSEDGAPTPVAITAVRALESSMDPAGEGVISAAVAASPLQEEYGTPVDRESAFEILAARAEQETAAPEEDVPAEKSSGGAKQSSSARKSSAKDDGLFGSPAVKSFLRSAGTVLGREITRGLFGTRKRR